LAPSNSISERLYADGEVIEARHEKLARDAMRTGPDAAPSIDPALALALRHALGQGLYDGLAPPEQIECAELCLSAGLTTQARELYQLAFIRQGFSPEYESWRRDLALATRLWSSAPAQPGGDRPRHAVTLELAATELRQLFGVVSLRLPDDFGRDEPIPPLSRPHPLTGWFETPASEPIPEHIADTIDQLYGLLTTSAGSERPYDADRLTELLRLADTSQPRLDYRGFANAPFPRLVDAVNFAALQLFVRCQRDLMFSPLGSLDLLHRAASSHAFGLGPYFSNIGQIARRSADVFELVRLAQSAHTEKETDPDELLAWVVLLSRGAKGDLLFEIIDDLGDLDARPALAAIFDRMAHWPEKQIEFGLLWRLRDTALDNGDYDLAARVQRLVAQLRPDEILEQRILGDIQASGGYWVAAEQSFIHCLLLDPNDSEARERLAALKTRKFERFMIREGFGTPQDRKLLRLRRRETAETKVGVSL
jgi:hypothetical protein